MSRFWPPSVAPPPPLFLLLPLLLQLKCLTRIWYGWVRGIVNNPNNPNPNHNLSPNRIHTATRTLTLTITYPYKLPSPSAQARGNPNGYRAGGGGDRGDRSGYDRNPPRELLTANTPENNWRSSNAAATASLGMFLTLLTILIPPISRPDCASQISRHIQEQPLYISDILEALQQMQLMKHYHHAVTHHVVTVSALVIVLVVVGTAVTAVAMTETLFASCRLQIHMVSNPFD